MTSRLLFSLPLLLCVACGVDNPTNTQKFHGPLTAGCKETAVENQYLVQWKDGSVSVEGAKDEEDFKSNFLAEHWDNVERAEHDYVVNINPVPKSEVSTMITNDPEDWGQTDSEGSWAWENGLDGHGVIVAVIDSGADISHPQLSNQVYKNSREVLDGIDNDENGYTDDISGWDFVHWTSEMTGDLYHGTHVSGIVLADHTVGKMKGMAPKAQLLPLKFIDGRSGFISNAIYAIDYAVNIAKRENKPLIVNASWGGTDCSVTLQTKMNEFNSRRVLFAVAAGNDGRDLSTYPIYPASFGLDSEITVAAHSLRNVLASFSNFGRRVSLSAPGLDIFSLAPGGDYARESGTSMATPFVTGAAALLWGMRPDATTAQIKQVLFDSVESGPFDVQLHGKLNIRKAKLLLEKL